MCAKARVKAKARQQAKREYKRQGGRLSIHPPGWETAARSTPRLSTLHLSFPAPSNNLSLRLVPFSPLFRSRSQTLMGLPSLANKWALGATWRAKCARQQRTFHSEQGISHSTSKIYGSRKMINSISDLLCFLLLLLSFLVFRFVTKHWKTTTRGGQVMQFVRSLQHQHVYFRTFDPGEDDNREA